MFSLKMRFVGLFSAAVLSLGGAACGDDDGGSGHHANVSDSKTVDSLTKAEEKNMCIETRDKLDGVQPAIKRFGCVLALSLAGQCSDAKIQECLARPDDSEDADEHSLDCDKIDDEPTTCKATVGELRACMDEQVAMFEELGQAKCSKPQDADPSPPPVLQSPACKALEQKCPGFNKGPAGADEDEDEDSAFPTSH